MVDALAAVVLGAVGDGVLTQGTGIGQDVVVAFHRAAAARVLAALAIGVGQQRHMAHHGVVAQLMPPAPSGSKACGAVRRIARAQKAASREPADKMLHAGRALDAAAAVPAQRGADVAHIGASRHVVVAIGQMVAVEDHAFEALHDIGARRVAADGALGVANGLLYLAAHHLGGLPAKVTALKGLHGLVDFLRTGVACEVEMRVFDAAAHA